MKAGWKGVHPGLPKRSRWSFLEVAAFTAFLIWSAAGLYFTLAKITPSSIAHWPISLDLVSFVQGCLAYGDPILIFLAFANTHLHAARQWSAPVARRWGLIVLVLAFGIETIGARTGLPFGPYHYTTAFGPMLGVVPLAIPLAWHVVVTNALFLVRMITPYSHRVTEALLTGGVCAGYDAVLEPFATTVKHYWIWTGGAVPMLNYIAWFIVSALPVLFFAPDTMARHRYDPRAVLIIAITIAIFVAGELVNGLNGY